MTQTFKARQMVPSKDTIAVMALHYGLKPSTVRDVIARAGVKVIREDGYKGKLVDLGKKNSPFSSAVVVGLSPSLMRRKFVAGWDDGTIGVDPKTTKLSRRAIRAVSQWAWQKSLENDGDN